MRKAIFALILFGMIVSSCKKEESGPGDRPYVLHYAYVQGTVIDSVTGSPLTGARIYFEQEPFYYLKDTTNGSGMYVCSYFWVTGGGHDGPAGAGRPDDSTDFFVSVSGINGTSNVLRFKAALLVENDTLLMQDILAKPNAYISAHVKDVSPLASSPLNLSWYPILEGISSVQYPTGADTIAIRTICPGFKTYMRYNGLMDSVIVGPGDTAFVDVFY